MPEMLRSLGRFTTDPPRGWKREYNAYGFYDTVDDYGPVYWSHKFQDWLRYRDVLFQHLHVRPPEHEYSVWSVLSGRRDPNPADDWHQDSVSGLQRAQVGVWANREPTLLRPRNQRCTEPGNIYQPEPYEVILFDNNYYEHRCPEMTPEVAKDRWFVRFYVDPQRPSRARADGRLQFDSFPFQGIDSPA